MVDSRDDINLVDSDTGTVEGNVLSLADKDTKNANGTSHRQIVNTASTWNIITEHTSVDSHWSIQL